MKEELDIERLEDVNFTLDKEAFKAKILYCSECNQNTKLIRTEISLPDSSISIKLDVFRCVKCNKEYLNFEEAKKLDKALILSRLMSHDTFKIKKSLSFDGDNYIFRIPAEITKNLGKKPQANLIPLSSKDLMIHLEKD